MIGLSVEHDYGMLSVKYISTFSSRLWNIIEEEAERLEGPDIRENHRETVSSEHSKTTVLMNPLQLPLHSAKDMGPVNISFPGELLI